MRSRSTWPWLAMAALGCNGAGGPSQAPSGGPPADPEQAARSAMVRTQLQGRDIVDARVLAAMRKVPRHEFVPADMRAYAYDDRPLPIGHGATISQPYVVALMTQLAEVGAGERVLDVGTGSGYQAAILAEMGAQVHAIEIVEPLAEQAQQRLTALGYDVTVRAGDGWAGWPEHAPFHAIIVAAAPPSIPTPLVEQLAIGGRMVVPVGERLSQELVVLTRGEDGVTERRVIPVAFVPMVGEAQRRP